jgi:hypothetical protein
MIGRRTTWLVVFVATALIAGVLGLYRTGAAAQKEEREPFANAVAQRAEMIALLKDIQAQLKEQNQLLGSGKLTVIVQTEKKEE